MLFACFRLDCEGHEGRIEAMHHAQEAIMTRLNRLDIQLTRFNMLLNRIIATEGDIMSEIDDRTAQVLAEIGDATTAQASSAADVERALADLKASLGGTLTADQVAHFDAIDAGLAGIKSGADAITAAVEATDPTPAAPPADGTQPTA